MVRTVSFIGMILGNNYIKIISAFLMILVNVAKIFYEYHKEKTVLNFSLQSVRIIS